MSIEPVVSRRLTLKDFFSKTVCLKQANSANVNFSVLVLLLSLKKANCILLTFLATEECKRVIKCRQIRQ